MGGDLDVASVPRAGSSFVLAIPAGRTVDSATIAASLDRTLNAEHARLEEAGMLRRLQAMGRGAGVLRGAPAGEPGGSTDQRPLLGAGNPGMADNPLSLERRAVQLRVLEARSPDS